LIDLNILDLIVEAADLGPNDVVLEIGSGTGTLTALMAAKGASVVAVDVDPAMARLTGEAVADFPNARVLNIDALANKNTLDPTIVDNVLAGLAAGESRQFKLIANLPYHVATPVIVNTLVHPKLAPALFVVTIQKELAARMTASPSTSDYGAVSVLVQGLAEVSFVRTLPPSVFWPRPKVESAVIAIRPSADKRAAVGDIAWFHDVVRKIFLQRRKYLRHSLAGLWSEGWGKAEVDAWLLTHGTSGQRRAESLSVAELIGLARALHERWRDSPELAATEPAVRLSTDADDTDPER
jgi:16S rRNA (adenine1518-N6/adenine1519-N6)-dimethyltransferase